MRLRVERHVLDRFGWRGSAPGSACQAPRVGHRQRAVAARGEGEAVPGRRRRRRPRADGTLASTRPRWRPASQPLVAARREQPPPSGSNASRRLLPGASGHVATMRWVAMSIAAIWLVSSTLTYTRAAFGRGRRTPRPPAARSWRTSPVPRRRCDRVPGVVEGVNSRREVRTGSHRVRTRLHRAHDPSVFSRRCSRCRCGRCSRSPAEIRRDRDAVDAGGRSDLADHRVLVEIDDDHLRGVGHVQPAAAASTER